MLFRTDAGAPYLVDAYCAHRRDSLSVPHGWCDDGASGKCIDVPYTDVGKVPHQAKVRSSPVIERNRMIWAWHHLEGGTPFYDVPEVQEFSDPEWSEP